jgi:hypothetical protein
MLARCSTRHATPGAGQRASGVVQARRDAAAQTCQMGMETATLGRTSRLINRVVLRAGQSEAAAA